MNFEIELPFHGGVVSFHLSAWGLVTLFGTLGGFQHDGKTAELISLLVGHHLLCPPSCCHETPEVEPSPTSKWPSWVGLVAQLFRCIAYSSY